MLASIFTRLKTSIDHSAAVSLRVTVLLDKNAGTFGRWAMQLRSLKNKIQSSKDSTMSDGEYIAKLMAIGADSNLLQTAQHVAAKKLLDYDGEIYPQDGCAITLSVLLQEAGIAVPDTYLAITLGNTLRKQRN